MSELQKSAKLRGYIFRFGGEAVLIVVSVFVAILLESMWQERAATIEAKESLAQVRQSLEEDLAFLAKVEQEQLQAKAMIEQLVQWTNDTESLSNEQVSDIFLNYTIPVSVWPRRAAWDSMVAAGQLRLLNAPELTTMIGNYYEYHLTRVEYNSKQYDDIFVAVFEEDLSKLWDYGGARLLSTNPDDLAYFRNRLIQVTGWNTYYLDAVKTNRRVLNELMEEIDEFLK